MEDDWIIIENMDKEDYYANEDLIKRNRKLLLYYGCFHTFSFFCPKCYCIYKLTKYLVQ